MRIAYLAHVNGGGESGVLAKIAAQIGAWRSHGHTARLHLFTRSGLGPAQSATGDAVVERYGGAWSRLTAMTRLVRAIRRFRPDVVYVRWDLYYPPMEWLPRSARLVVEINTDDVAEYDLRPTQAGRYNRATRARILGRADALVFVTDELRRAASFKPFRGRRSVIGNGVDLAAYPELPPAAGPRPSLAFVGSTSQPWQGVDKVLRLAELRPEWRFEVVGGDPYRPAPPNVRRHGTLDRAAALDVLARADVGLGTLALHRKGMDEACALKVREYLAVGLPVIYANIDRDADAVEPWVLRLANTETNVIDEVDRIDTFVEGSRGRRVPRARVAHIDAGVKEQARLALFEEVVRAAHG